MNNNFLIFAVLIALSGCATDNRSSALVTGTGNSTTSLEQNASHKTAATKASSDTLFKAPIKSNSKYKTISSSYKNNELANFNVQQKPEISKKMPLNRYSSGIAKDISHNTPASSAGNPSNYAVSGASYKVLPFSNGFKERGVASWYGHDFHGEKTSNGEIYNMYGMTAAHKRLPIPSYVRVTNLKNKRNVVLRINDRGPFYGDRVIDLSYAAAQKLDIHQPGTEVVKIETIKTKHKEKIFLQLGVFSNQSNAQMLQKKITDNKLPKPTVKEVLVGGKLAYRVQFGPIFSTAKVNELNAKLAKIGISETWYVTDNKSILTTSN